MDFFEPSVMGTSIHNFVVFAPMMMKFGKNNKLDIFYTTATKKFLTSLPSCNYDVTTYILADA